MSWTESECTYSVFDGEVPLGSSHVGVCEIILFPLIHMQCREPSQYEILAARLLNLTRARSGGLFYGHTGDLIPDEHGTFEQAHSSLEHMVRWALLLKSRTRGHATSVRKPLIPLAVITSRLGVYLKYKA